MQMTAWGLAACLAAGLSGACWAQDLKPKHSDTAIGFDNAGGFSNFTLTVTGPNGFHKTVESPSLDLREAGAREDGVYSYQLAASTSAARAGLDNGRPAGAKESMLKSVSVSGQVQLKNGEIQKLPATAVNEGEKIKRPQRERK